MNTMKSILVELLLLLWLCCCGVGHAFLVLNRCAPTLSRRQPYKTATSLCSANSGGSSSSRNSEPNDGDEVLNGVNGEVSADVTQEQEEKEEEEPSVWDCTLPQNADQARIAAIKRDIFQLGASYNRGFAASPRARETTLQLVEELEQFNTQKNAADGVDGSSITASPENNKARFPPLQGTWRLLWTTGTDVLVLDANPLATTSAIYQVFEPPMVTNVIDLQPKIQALASPIAGVGNTLLRARVETRANQRSGKPNRVGLVFERVKLQPLQLLGSDIDIFPPLGFDWPRWGAETTEPTGPDSPGYFEVTYLDDEVLVYRQQLKGLFVYIKVDSMDP